MNPEVASVEGCPYGAGEVTPEGVSEELIPESTRVEVSLVEVSVEELTPDGTEKEVTVV